MFIGALHLWYAKHFPHTVFKMWLLLIGRLPGDSQSDVYHWSQNNIITAARPFTDDLYGRFAHGLYLINGLNHWYSWATIILWINYLSVSINSGDRLLIENNSKIKKNVIKIQVLKTYSICTCSIYNIFVNQLILFFCSSNNYCGSQMPHLAISKST